MVIFLRDVEELNFLIKSSDTTYKQDNPQTANS